MSKMSIAHTKYSRLGYRLGRATRDLIDSFITMMRRPGSAAILILMIVALGQAAWLKNASHFPPATSTNADNQ